MLRFILSHTGEIITVNPTAVSTVIETTKAVHAKSLLSGANGVKNTAIISMSNGVVHEVDDPSRVVTRQIQEWRKSHECRSC